MFEFVVKFCIDDGGEEVKRGIVSGANYTEAMARVAEYIGDEDIIRITLTGLTDTTGILCYTEEFTSISEFVESY